MPYRRSLAVALVAYLAGLAICIHGPWDQLSRLLNPQKPFHYQSLKGRSDDEIASFMSGTPTSDLFHPADAPDSHFPENLWDTDPKAAALAFADANRTAAHRKLYKLTIDENPSIKAPDAGWMVFNDYRTLTAVHFGTKNPLLYHSHKDILFTNYRSSPYHDISSRTLQITPLSPEKARFIAHTVFWLEHIQTQCRQKGYVGTTTFISSHEHSGTLDWFVEKQAPRQISETLWDISPIAGRWSNDYEPETCINLTHHLLTQALPKHLGQNWEYESPFSPESSRTQLDRLKQRPDDAVRQQLNEIVSTAIARHFESPWPAPVLINLAECAGDQGLIKTLPNLERLASQLSPASADEKELSSLKDQIYNDRKTLSNADISKLWERYFPLKEKLNYDFPTQLRPPLTQSIRQLHALGQPAQLIELAKGNTDSTYWALQQLELSDPDAFTHALTSRFRLADEHDRRRIFETLAATNPPATRQLRDSLTQQEQLDLLFEITRFEITDAPASVQARIPELMEILANPNHLKNSSARGQAIERLSKISLDSSQQARFEQLLLNELLTSSDDHYAITYAATAAAGVSEPDRFWDALFQSASAATQSHHLEALLDSLAKLALANPDPRLAQLTEFIRLRFTRHQGSIKKLSLASLALDLHPLAPELAHYATFNAKIPDGEDTPKCNGGPEPPCNHRYHAARHVTALWLEPDPDTRARMWNAFLLNSPYEFCAEKTISSCLRDRYQSAMNAASPELRSQLIALTRSNPQILRSLPNWLK